MSAAFEKWQSSPPPKQELRKAEFRLIESEQGDTKLRTGVATEASPDHPERNEDSYYVSEERGIACVADGLGGGVGGDLASARATQSLTREQLARADVAMRHVMEAGRDEPMTSQEDVEDALKKALVHANDAVVRLHRSAEIMRLAVAKAEQKAGRTLDPKNAEDRERVTRLADSAGSTASLSKIWRDQNGADHITVANIGDSRIYRLRNGRLERLTKDHSIVQEIIDLRLHDTDGVPIEDDQNINRRVSRDEVERVYRKSATPAMHALLSILQRKGWADVALVDVSHIVLQNLGDEWSISVFKKTYPVEDGDIFLHCSDGLCDVATDAEMQAILNRFIDDPLNAAKELEQAAAERSKQNTHERAKPDDITALVTKYERKKAL